MDGTGEGPGTFGVKRRKVLSELALHPELDNADWLGLAEFHFGFGEVVKGRIVPALHDVLE